MLKFYRLTLLTFALVIGTCVSSTFATNVSGTISTNQTWTLANSPYVLTNDVTVSSGVTLTIEAGTNIYFPDEDYDLRIYGTLIADGTPQDSIKFYGSTGSYQGGSILFSSSSTNSLLDNVIIRNMGSPYSTYEYALVIETSSLTITNSKIVEGNRGGVRLTTTTAYPTMINCEISGFYSSYGEIWTHPSGLKNFSNNTLGQIKILTSSSTSGSVFWPSGSYTFSGDVTVTNGDTLTIEAGAKVYFPDKDYDLKIYGTLIADGTPQDSIKFYGSTNGSYQGGSILFSSSSTNSLLDNVIIRNMGSAFSTYEYALVIETSSLTITNSKIVEGNRGGVRLTTTTAYPTMINCEISGFYSSYGEIWTHPSGLKNFSNNTLGQIKILTSSSTSGSVFWPSGSYTFSGDVTVTNGDTLTIEAGTNIYFPDETYDLKIYGTLIADGTPQDSIKFYGNTSGSTQGGSILFSSSSTNSLLDNVIIRNMGSAFSTYEYALVIETSSLTITNSKIVEGNRGGVRLTTTTAYPTMVNCEISGFYSSYGEIWTHPSGLKNFSNNTLGLIKVLGSSATSSSVFWPSGSYIFSGDVSVTNGDTLTIQPGVEVYFPDEDYDLIVSGTLIADGTPQDSIKFYGSSGSYQGGNIRFYTTSVGSILDYVLVENMGDNSSSYDCGLYIQSSSVTIENSKIIDGEAYGIRVSNASPTISESVIMDNNSYGIYHTGSGTVNAINNWWGHSSGPLHSSQNPTGQGENISGNITFSPWLAEYPSLPSTDISPIQLTSQNIFSAGESYIPQALIANYDTLQASAPTTVKMLVSYDGSQVYSNTQSITWIPILSNDTVDFDSLKFYKSGTYDVTVITQLNNDSNTDNDTLYTSFQVLGDIAINEFMNFGLSQFGSDFTEFFEIANTSSQAIDISSWTIRNSANQIITVNGFTIPANDFAVFTRFDNAILNGGTPYDYQFNETFNLDDVSDFIVLRDSDGNTVDSVAYNATWNTTQGETFERKNVKLDPTDSNSWCKGSTVYGTENNKGTPGSASVCSSQLPEGNLSTSNLNFGGSILTNPVTLSAKIFSIGDSDLTVDSVAIFGSEFTTDLVLPDTLSAGDSLSFSITFLPTVSGLISGTAKIYTNDWDTPFHTISLNGEGIDGINPSQIQNFRIAEHTGTSVKLKWTATGDDTTSGTAVEYEIRQSTSEITSSNFYSATLLDNLPTPSLAGNSDSLVVTGLTSGTQYYFAIIAIDEYQNASPMATQTTFDKPEIISISDVPNDNGKQVRIEFRASINDYISGTGFNVLGYTVYRKVNSVVAPTGKNGNEIFESLPSGTWEIAFQTFIASGDTSYLVVVPTLADSNSTGINEHEFLVRAHSSNSSQINSISTVVAGHSVDNLAPSIPSNQNFTNNGNGTITGTWNAVYDSDLAFYTIWAEVSPDSFALVTQVPPNGLGLQTETFNVVTGALGYLVGSIDENGNESLPLFNRIKDVRILLQGNDAILSWSGKIDATFYRIYRNTNSDFATATEIGTYIPNGIPPTFTDSNAVTNGQKYFYFVTWEN